MLTHAFALLLAAAPVTAPADEPETLIQIDPRAAERAVEDFTRQAERAAERLREAAERAERRAEEDRRRREMETLAGAPKREQGGPGVDVGSLRGDPAYTLRGRGRTVYDSIVALGSGLGVLLPTVDAPRGAGDFDGNEKLWAATIDLHGQLVPGYRKLLHPALGADVGLGAAGVADFDGGDRFFAVRPDFVVTVTPRLDLELNVAGSFQLAAGFGYRWAYGLELPGVAPGALDGFVGSLQFWAGD